MEVVIILVFISLMLVVLALGFFAWCVKSRTLEHSDRLALLPLQEEDPAPSDHPQTDTTPRRS